MKNNNKPLFIYPDYIVQVLNQLMEDSVKNQNGILCKRTDIVEILYNQFNDFPITEQVYRMMWSWVNKMLDACDTKDLNTIFSNENVLDMDPKILLAFIKF